MTPQLSSIVLKAIGPCRILLIGSQDPQTLDRLLLDGCDAWMESALTDHPRYLPVGTLPPSGAPQVIAIEAATAHAVRSQLDRLHASLQSCALLMIAAGGQPRNQLENTLFQGGWRRHPVTVTVANYPSWQDNLMPELALYQPIPAEAAARWPLATLLKDRDLHMDMLREGSGRADAHIVRYSLAAQYVRPGDRVVDCACGLGYGTATMAAQAAGASFLGIDLDHDTVAYAQANYARPGLCYQQGNAAALDEIPDASVDLVVSMETIEHVPDWEAVLRTFRRILKPDGRLIASVPDQWVDETGEDPNPYHFHAFDWQKFNAGLSEYFVVEARYIQAAPGGFKLHRARRQLQQVSLDSTQESEWILAVASVNPLEDGAARKAEFRHPAFASALAAHPSPVIDFAASYDNPYLYRPLVQMGERLKDENRLYRLACVAMELSRSGSADQGAALCVAGYQALDYHNHHVIAQLLPYMEGYIEETAETARSVPHITRWRLSLAFLMGRMLSVRGEDANALAWFRRASEMEWESFSPLLATKAIAACFHGAALLLAHAQDDEAKDLFQRGLEISLRALAQPSQAIIGSVEAPIPFALQEIAEVADMGSQCALALNAWPLLARDRGLFWRQIDVKRFGIVSWAKQLEQVNTSLQQRVQDIRTWKQQTTQQPVPAS